MHIKTIYNVAFHLCIQPEENSELLYFLLSLLQQTKYISVVPLRAIVLILCRFAKIFDASNRARRLKKNIIHMYSKHLAIKYRICFS